MSENTTIDRNRIVEGIRGALSEVLDTDCAGIGEEAELFDQLGLDSTGVLELLMLLEESLDVEMETEELEMSNFHTVGSLADFLAAEYAAATASG
ncbi:acyl carrier protein [Sciscionella sediminilitoris]|uniref:acyl carrier protein n=1 Tax=Sciscionella sediminilitoris TaxID=1445613 RepID=UPI0004DFB723|nr:phosphopantetheine-binding protein [Sciscionella sp. SE31]